MLSLRRDTAARYLPAVIFLAALSSPSPAAAERVARVVDGDTILLEDGRKVRYAGINAPEDGEPGFRESTQANNFLVGGKDVWLEFGRRQTEMHERLLGPSVYCWPRKDLHLVHGLREEYRRGALLGTPKDGLEQGWRHGDREGFERALRDQPDVLMSRHVTRTRLSLYVRYASP